MIAIKTYYIKKMDKRQTIAGLRKIKIERDNCYIYIKREKDISKIIKKFQQHEIEKIVLSKELQENTNLINALNANNIKIFDGKWLIKYLSFEILDYIAEKNKIKREEIEISITANEITDLVIETIKKLAKQYKRVTVVTNHIDKLRKIEKEIYDKEGILIIISNNQKKSLTKSQIILNIDFNKQILNRYKINENAIIINLEGDMKIEDKRFNGITINDYEIEVGREETIWRENIKEFRAKNLLESVLYVRDTFSNIRAKISKNKVAIKELQGLNGKI